jgi:uncharacterized SAM-dependent methyltransferase
VNRLPHSSGVLLGLQQSPKTLPCKYFYDKRGSQLFDQICDLDEYYPTLEVLPVCADFTMDFEQPIPRCEPTHCAVYFPGSTIGNFERRAAEKLLARIAPRRGTGGELFIGIDLQKDRETLEAAYNDARGVTAEFNLNLLRRINRELVGDFRLEQFRHVATYNAEQSRIEIFLQSLRDQVVTVAGKAFGIAANPSNLLHRTILNNTLPVTGYSTRAYEAIRHRAIR